MLPSQDKEMRVKQIYSELDRKFEEEETERKATESGIAYINLYGYPIDTQVLKLLPKEMAESMGLAAFYKEGRDLKVGITEVSEKIKPGLKYLLNQGLNVEAYLVSQSSFKHLLDEYNKIISVEHRSDKIAIASSDERWQISHIKDLSERLKEVSATEVLETLLGAALNMEASDIHVEPEAAKSKVRFRIDGVLQDVLNLELEVYRQFVSRVKILSKVKLNVIATPQDGSFSLVYDDLHIDIRVSVIPSAFGESIVMRILKQNKSSLQFEDLGLSGMAYERILKEIDKPNGMLLTTGPTGSGKTTTLYAILNKLNEPGVKIITLEDPVEYKIEGITQTPIDARAGMTFAAGLRSVLRQDPDIVMVGEMRDLETSEIACQAALTGHIVLSTLHTNDAPSAIPRLLDLGVKPFVLAPAINAIIAQRLVRKICTFCKSEYQLPQNLRSRVDMILGAIPKSAKIEIPKNLAFYHSPGCEKCRGLGYKGRIGVYEVFTISEMIEKLITKNATNTEIKKQAVAEGMVTMAQDGILKALKGITDIEEVFRVTEE